MSHIPHLLKEPKFPSQFIPEYIRLLERFEVVLFQTPQTLLIPSRLPRVKPSSVTLPPASPGCEMMSLFAVFFITFHVLLPPSSLPPHFLAVFLIYFIFFPYVLISPSHSSDNPSLSLLVHPARFLAPPSGQAHCIPQEDTPRLHQGGHTSHLLYVTLY